VIPKLKLKESESPKVGKSERLSKNQHHSFGLTDLPSFGLNSLFLQEFLNKENNV